MFRSFVTSFMNVIHVLFSFGSKHLKVLEKWVFRVSTHLISRREKVANK